MKKAGLNLILCISILYSENSYSQDVINPYTDWNNRQISEINYTHPLSISPNLSLNECLPNTMPDYDGEYQIYLSCTPWHKYNIVWDGWAGYDIHNFLWTYKTEVVSFPFAPDCAFSSTGCADGGSIRILTVPDDTQFVNSHKQWIYPAPLNFQPYLTNISDPKPFVYDSHNYPISQPATIVSAPFVRNAPILNDRDAYPHTILRHVIELHCGLTPQDPILTSFSFLEDLTRGMMREYPFHATNYYNASKTTFDLCIAPRIFGQQIDYSGSTNCSAYGFFQLGSNCDNILNQEGGTIDYTPFDLSSDDVCNSINPTIYPVNISSPSDRFWDSNLYNVPLASNSLIATSFPLNKLGTGPAGYDVVSGNPGSMCQRIVNTGLVPILFFTINNNISLDYINPIEKVIYNPSEVTITASDLHFPHNYKFKTIRALYPFLQEVQRDNTTANGGVYASNELFNVPVTTDLYKENHVSSIYDPTNTDHRFASIYHLANNSKLTIEPCVQIFDATFEVNSGSEIVFENDLTNQVNVNRYQLLYNGGEVTKRRDNFLFQAETENKSILNYEAGDAILAGDHVDPAKAAGEYILTSQSNSSFVANNYIDLESGFHAENGSVFTASIQPVSIPTCTPNPPLRRGLSEQAIATENKTIQPAISLVSTPNPFVSDCYFIFSIEEQSEVSLSLYNSNGAEIASISNHKILAKGKYNYHFTGENLSSGLYLAKLIVNSKQKIIKLIKE